MKCISLWQPWATLVAIGAKKIETRSWPPNYVGPLAIHAAQRWTGEMRELCETYPFRSALAAARYRPQDLPRGYIVATCRLAGWMRIVRGGLARPHQLGIVAKLVVDPEASFGDYMPGRWAWLLEDVQPLPVPVPCKGHQSFFNWDPSSDLRSAPAQLPTAGLERKERTA